MHLVIDVKSGESHVVAIEEADFDFVLPGGAAIRLQGQNQIDTDLAAVERSRLDAREWYISALGITEMDAEKKGDSDLFSDWAQARSAAQARIDSVVTGGAAPGYTQEQRIGDLTILGAQPPPLL